MEGVFMPDTGTHTKWSDAKKEAWRQKVVDGAFYDQTLARSWEAGYDQGSGSHEGWHVATSLRAQVAALIKERDDAREALATERRIVHRLTIQRDALILIVKDSDALIHRTCEIIDRYEDK